MSVKIEKTLFGKQDYYRSHAICPKCKKDDLELDLTPIESGIDNYSAKCLNPKCDWKGKINELIARQD